VTPLSLTDVATRAGITLNSARTYHKRANAHRAAGNPRPGDLPEPDLHLGGIPGWNEDTITAWLASRPRKPISPRELQQWGRDHDQYSA
jgi:hypothetical protein